VEGGRAVVLLWRKQAAAAQQAQGQTTQLLLLQLVPLRQPMASPLLLATAQSQPRLGTRALVQHPAQRLQTRFQTSQVGGTPASAVLQPARMSMMTDLLFGENGLECLGLGIPE